MVTTIDVNDAMTGFSDVCASEKEEGGTSPVAGTFRRFDWPEAKREGLSDVSIGRAKAGMPKLFQSRGVFSRGFGISNSVRVNRSHFAPRSAHST